MTHWRWYSIYFGSFCVGGVLALVLHCLLHGLPLFDPWRWLGTLLWCVFLGLTFLLVMEFCVWPD